MESASNETSEHSEQNTNPFTGPTALITFVCAIGVILLVCLIIFLNKQFIRERKQVQQNLQKRARDGGELGHMGAQRKETMFDHGDGFGNEYGDYAPRHGFDPDAGAERGR